MFISIFDKSGYACSYGDDTASLSYDLNVIGFMRLIDNLYMLDIERSYNKIMQVESQGIKHKLKWNSAILWHKCLGHIVK